MAGWGTTDLAPDATELPVTVTRPGLKPLAVVLFVLAAGMAVAAIVIGIRGPGRPNPLIAARLALGAGAALMVLLSASAWKHMVRWDFTPDGVSYWRRGLFGVKEWAEPLDTYEGVLARSEVRSNGKTTYVVYLVELKHPANKRHTVQLYMSMSNKGHRGRQEHYARLFGAPALIQTADGYEVRAPEDLDKSVRERVAEGSLAMDFDPRLGPPGERLRMHVDGTTLVVRTAKAPLLNVGIGGFLLLSAVGLAVAGLLVRREPLRWILMGAGAVDALVAAVLLVPALIIREELLVSPDEVRKQHRWPWGTFGGSAVPADRIEEVLVRSTTGGSVGGTVQCVTDDVTVHFGRSLPKADKAWVRDCIIAVIGSGGPATPAAPSP